MKKIIKDGIEEYQCPGCVSGCDISCFQKAEYSDGCGKHLAGTMGTGIGKFFLGMPKGFNRLGDTKLGIDIFEVYTDDSYDMWNIPVWKFRNEFGHTLVRGMMPRRNEPFLHIYLEDCLDKINCLEISQDDINGMD